MEIIRSTYGKTKKFSLYCSSFPDCKILFHVINSLVAVFPGILTLSCGVTIGSYLRLYAVSGGIRVLTPSLIVYGLVTLGLTVVGCCGAVLKNRIILLIYCGLIGLITAVQVIVGVAVACYHGPAMAALAPVFLPYSGLMFTATVLAGLLAMAPQPGVQRQCDSQPNLD